VSGVDNGSPVLSEHYEQATFVAWFRQTYPSVRIFAIPNGGSRSRTQGAKLKLEGVTPGVPDLFIPAWNLWVEMKRSVGGRLSAEQKDWISYLQDVGHCAIVCAGCNDAQEKVRQFEKGSLSNSSPAASSRG
jgi:hypothetical protein